MRLGVVWIPSSNANYRAIHPMRAMARRGHEVVVPRRLEGGAELNRLTGCDVVHVYRRADEQTRRVLAALAHRGIAITYDNDDDLRAIPKESPDYKKFGGLTAQRLFADSVKAARMASTFTTTTKRLEGVYRSAGVARTEVIGNYLWPEAGRPCHRHDGIVIGWVAGIDHRADTARIGIEDALRRLLAKYEKVRVESIGVRLGLAERYRHDRLVHFDELPSRIGGFDIGIAPLADMPHNLARSDIKLKEYAASGIPWLASPVGPYVGLGEAEGGRLVSDDGWFDALEALILARGERERLGRAGNQWADRNTIDAVAERWEQVFARAAGKPARATVTVRSGLLPPGVAVRMPVRPPSGDVAGTG